MKATDVLCPICLAKPGRPCPRNSRGHGGSHIARHRRAIINVSRKEET